MKKTYNQPEVQVTEIQCVTVIGVTVALSAALDLTALTSRLSLAMVVSPMFGLSLLYHKRKGAGPSRRTGPIIIS